MFHQIKLVWGNNRIYVSVYCTTDSQTMFDDIPPRLHEPYPRNSTKHTSVLRILMRYGPVTVYGDINLQQHWLTYGLFVAWQYQATTWINVDLSSLGYYAIHLNAISLEIPVKVINTVHLNSMHLKTYITPARMQSVNSVSMRGHLQCHPSNTNCIGHWCRTIFLSSACQNIQLLIECHFGYGTLP